jgi:hypothetical protein
MGVLVNQPWRPAVIVSAYGKLYVGDNYGPWVSELTPDSYEDSVDTGYPLRRVWTTQPFQNNMKTLFVASVELTVESGTGDATTPNPQMTLEISRDGGQTFEAGRDRPIGAAGVYSSRAIWPRCGRFARFAVFRFSTSENVRVTAIQLTADVVGGR